MNRPRRTLDLFEQHESRGHSFVLDVALDVPLNHGFSYLSGRPLATGIRVAVPFGRRTQLGVVLGSRPRLESDCDLRPIGAVLDETPAINQELFAFLRELGRYYFAPIGEVLALALPGLPRRTAKSAGVSARIVPEHQAVWLLRTALPRPERLGLHGSDILDQLDRDGPTLLSRLVQATPDKQSARRSAANRLLALGLITRETRAGTRSAFAHEISRDQPPEMTEEQRFATHAITDAIGLLEAPQISNPGEPRKTPHFLLYGITGSGKTEVYLRSIEAALGQGRGVIVLVPEIALTPQLLARYRARFGDAVAVVHSALDASARHAMWEQLRSGVLRVAIGARSALFAPVPDLGLVIVDEEHDSSFKQEDGVRYHARDAALLRAHLASAVCVLGSATPSLEAHELTRRGKLTELRMRARARKDAFLPTIEVVDLRRVGPGPSGSRLLSLPLHRAIETTLAQGEQIILFLNRRGFAPALVCEGCGEVVRCPSCEVAMTLHLETGISHRRGITHTLPPGLRCHYCDRVDAIATTCSKCHGSLSQEGVGTERLTSTLAQSFPSARIGRLDRDIGGSKEVEKILDGMRLGELDILVGTQMVAKGHDLPRVTLVGIINVDGALSMPDFRASERTFQLLVQVSGRAGRAERPGHVILQTRNPGHPAVQAAAQSDVDGFLEQEREARKELQYPPFGRCVLVRLEGTDESQVVAAAEVLALAARDAARDVDQRGEVIVSGPTAAPIAKVRDRYRYRLFLRGERGPLRQLASILKETSRELSKSVHIVMDIDPQSML